MANNPLYPGYSPKKPDEEPVNPLYPGYYSGQPLRKSPQSSNYLKPIEYEFDDFIDEIDEIAKKIYKFPVIGPTWIRDRIVDDWKGQFKVAVMPEVTGVPITELDDYAIEDYAGAQTVLSLNPKDWGVSRKGIDFEKTKKQAIATIKSWAKESTGFDLNEIYHSNWSDEQNRQTGKLWELALGTREGDTKIQGASENKAQKSIADRLTVNYPDMRSAPDPERGPLNVRGVTASSIDDLGRPITYDDLYKDATSTVGAFARSRDTPKLRDTNYRKFVVTSAKAVNIEVQDVFRNNPAEMSRHEGAVAFYDLRYKALEAVDSLETVSFKGVIKELKKIDLGYKDAPAADVLNVAKQSVVAAKDKVNSQIRTAEELFRNGKISEASLNKFKSQTNNFQEQFSFLEKTIDKAVDGKISVKQAIKTLGTKSPDRSFTNRSTFKNDIAGDLRNDLTRSLGDKKNSDEIGYVLNDPALAAANIEFTAKKMAPIHYVLSKDRVRFAAKEYLDGLERGGLAGVAEKYVWNKIKEKLPAKIERVTSGTIVGDYLKKRNYFGLHIEDDVGFHNKLESKHPKRFARFEKKFGYKVNVEIDGSIASAYMLKRIGKKKIRVAGGDYFKVFNGNKNWEYLDQLKARSGTRDLEILSALFSVNNSKGDITALRDTAARLIFWGSASDPNIAIKLNKIFGNGGALEGINNEDTLIFMLEWASNFYKKLDGKNGVDLSNIDSEKISQLANFVKSMSTHNAWRDKNFKNLTTEQQLSLLKSLREKNKSLNNGYKLDRKFLGRLDKINNRMQTIKKKVEKSFIGKTVKIFTNWKEIIANKAGELISKLLSKLLGLTAASTGFLTLLVGLIQALAEKIIKKTLDYTTAFLKAILTLNTQSLEKLIQQDFNNIVMGSLYVVLIILLPIFLISATFVGIIGGSVSPVDMTGVSSIVDDDICRYDMQACEDMDVSEMPTEYDTTSEIAQLAYEIVSGLERGFWCGYNDSRGLGTYGQNEDGDQIFNAAIFEALDYNACEEAVRAAGDEWNFLFWCTWLTRQVYRALGATNYSDYLLPSANQTMLAFQKENSDGYSFIPNAPGVIENIKAGDVIFYSDGYAGCSHVGIVYNVTWEPVDGGYMGTVITLESNATWRSATIFTTSTGAIQSFNGLSVVGFGRWEGGE